MIRRFFLLATITSIITALASPGSQADEAYSRIARLSYLEGQVSFQRAAESEWTAASINFPLQPGDRVYTGKEGRAEIEFDDGSVLHLAEDTDFELLSSNDNLVQLRIFDGLASLTVSSNLEFEVDTPAAAFNTLQRGVYRFDVIETGATDAIVRSGELEAANNRFSRRLRIGDLLHVESGANGYERLSRYDRQDRWDEWTDRRDSEVHAYTEAQYIPAGVSMGSSELKRYGRWINIESYGVAWTPLYVSASWSPYSVGRWCYRPNLGWTWVSYEPWGWLPYHYGRWQHHAKYGWCWIPGPAFSFSFWSPGLVSFHEGPGWISWCPLGPGDYYDVDNYYFNRRLYSFELARLRKLHVRGPNELFNRNVRGAFRVVEIDHFRNGIFSDRDRDRDRDSRWKNVEPWRHGAPVRGRLNIQPTHVSYSGNPARPAARPNRLNPLPSVVRNVPQTRDRNRSGVTPVLTPGGYTFTGQSRERMRDNRPDNPGNNAPRNRPYDNRSNNSTPPDNRRDPSRWQSHSRPDEGGPQPDRTPQSPSRARESDNSYQQPRMTQPPSIPQRQPEVRPREPMQQAPPQSQDSGSVRRFGTQRPPDVLTRKNESGSQDRSESRRSDNDSSRQRGNSDNHKSDAPGDSKKSNDSNHSDESGRRARPR